MHAITCIMNVYVTTIDYVIIEKYVAKRCGVLVIEILWVVVIRKCSINEAKKSGI